MWNEGPCSVRHLSNNKQTESKGLAPGGDNRSGSHRQIPLKEMIAYGIGTSILERVFSRKNV